MGSALSGISIHALLAESDRSKTLSRQPRSRFLSTLSLRRATDRHKTGRVHNGYFYPRSPCGERLDTSVCIFCKARISIHALLAESDTKQPPMTAPPRQFLSTLSLRRATPRACPVSSRRPYFYPRSPCGERLKLLLLLMMVLLFLSTLSLRRATNTSIAGRMTENDFYPRSPCGERQTYLDNKTTQQAISIHALLAESDRAF